LQYKDFGNGNILLTFDKSPSENVISYKIYWDSGTGIINYDLPIAVINASDTLNSYSSFVSGLNPDLIYTFGVRATDNIGIEEKNISVIVKVQSTRIQSSVSDLHAYIKNPAAGKSITGNRVNVMAELSLDDDSYIFESTIGKLQNIKNNFSNSFKGNPTDYIETSVSGNNVTISVLTKEIDPNKIIINELSLFKTTGNLHYSFNYAGIQNGYYKYTASVSGINISSDSLYILLIGSGKKIKTEQVKSILFQMKQINDTLWADMIPVEANTSNPDYSAPYFIISDFTVLTAGFYNLRAIVTDINNNADQTPPIITIEINHTNPDSKKSLTSEGMPIVIEKIQKNSKQVISIAEAQNGLFTNIKINENSIDTATELTMEILNSQSDIVKNAVSQINETPIGNFMEANFADTTIPIKQSNPLEIIIPYKDADNDNIIDGTKIIVDSIGIWTYSFSTNKWEKLEVIEFDKENKQITSKIPHFSMFVIMGSLAPASVENASVYPNPFIPYDNNIDNGIPYQSGNDNSGIIFKNIAQNSTIEIYTLLGKIVYKETVTASTDKYQWDVKNSNGKELASGVYIYIIKGPNGGKKTGKLSIVR